ncbi:MAG: YfhO family protein, partial [Ruminococcus sp.]|nr:YfhO family protein [Ruminococcus sp.]
MKTKLNNKDIYALGGIILLSAIIMIACMLFWGGVYGSQMDWVSQHYMIPEYFRTLFYDTHELFPSYAANIGGGESIYSLSYYGLYSPVILISYLLPFVPMGYYIMISSAVVVFASESIFYFFLRKSHSLKVTAFVSAMFGFSMPLIFQSHRHIMFIAFMPFMLLAMHFTDRYFDKGRRAPLILCAFLMIMCNYFFAVTALFALAAYGLIKVIDEGKSLGESVKRYIPFVMQLFISVLMSCVLILPTAYGLLAGRDENNDPISLISFLPTMRIDWLTYHSYSMGLTGFGVFACIYAAFHAKGSKRFIAVLTLLFAVCPLLVFILNGTLYFDSKVLVSFLPLALMVVAWFVSELLEERVTAIKLPMILFIASAPVPLLLANNISVYAYLADAAVTAVLIISLAKGKSRRLCGAFIAVAVIACVSKNLFDELVTTERYDSIEAPAITTLVNEASKDSMVRTAVDVRRVDTPNKVYSISHYQDTIYSSIHSKDYNTFFFEKMCNENEYRNSALTTRTKNLFFNCFMGDRYIVSDKKQKCYGYELIKATDDGYYLYENKNALPLAYHTGRLMSRREFDKLGFPESVEALSKYTITEQDIPDTGFVSSFERVDIGDIFDISDKLSGSDSCKLLKDGTRSFEFKDYDPKDTEYNGVSYSIPLPEECRGKLIFISFHVENPKAEHDEGVNKIGDVTVIINGVKNKLTDPDARYFNNNNDMEYVLSDCGDKLDITVKGKSFQISDVKVYAADTSAIESMADDKTAFEFDPGKTSGDTLSGHITAPEDGYLATSFLYLEGMTAEVDGEQVTPEKVNTAFVGLPLKKGEHSITITYHAP